MRKGEVGTCGGGQGHVTGDMGSTISSVGSRMTALGIWPRLVSPKVHGKDKRGSVESC